MRTPAPIDVPGVPSTPIPGGYRLKTVDAHHIDVIAMSSCARIIEQVDGLPPLTWNRYWCYYGQNRLVHAILAAHAWDGSPDTEPVGWVLRSDGKLQ